MAYPIARLLEAKKVPFVFMTGYGSETIAMPFANVRVFQKPLERELLRDLFTPGPGQPQRDVIARRCAVIAGITAQVFNFEVRRAVGVARR